MTVYIDWCTSTRPTGLKIKEAIGAELYTIGTALEPDDVFICWGGKTQPTNQHGATYINSPGSVGANRNKLVALEKMALVVNTPIVRTIHEIERSSALLPVIARTAYHQGGKGFWYCNSVTDCRAALNAGAEFFVEAQSIQDEYRAHVFDGVIIHASRKVPHQHPQKAWVKHMMDKLYPDGWQEIIQVDEMEGVSAYSAHTALKKAARYAGLPDMTCRSNNRGWKFVPCPDLVGPCLLSARNAVEAMNMDFGAVDLLVNDQDETIVLEVNSAPGLEGTVLEAWVNAFQSKIRSLSVPNIADMTDRMAQLSDHQLYELNECIEGLLNG